MQSLKVGDRVRFSESGSKTFISEHQLKGVGTIIDIMDGSKYTFLNRVEWKEGDRKRNNLYRDQDLKKINTFIF